jgi:hypothetical protein
MIVSPLFNALRIHANLAEQVGCDVTHPSPGSLKGTPSIAGVVASTDSFYAQYPASLALQESRKEMITNLKGMMIERLKLWHSKNRTYPDYIIVYRDGVSEGLLALIATGV